MSTNIKLLDGGFGQAIINKGLDQIGTLWGCSAYLNEQDHQKVIDTHLDFINAGSKIITTSNFTIRKRRLAQNKLEDKEEEKEEYKQLDDDDDFANLNALENELYQLNQEI